MRSPRSPQSSTVASASSRRTATGPGRGRHAAHRGEEERAELRVAQRVRAHRQAVVVVEQAERRLLARAQEVLLVGHAAQPHDEVGQAAVDVGDDVEQAGAARGAAPRLRTIVGAVSGAIWCSPSHASVSVRSAWSRPSVMTLVSFPFRHSSAGVSRRHSSGGRSSGTRSNHKKP